MIKQRKKILGLALAVATAATLATACGKKDDAATSATTTVASSTTEASPSATTTETSTEETSTETSTTDSSTEETTTEESTEVTTTEVTTETSTVEPTTSVAPPTKTVRITHPFGTVDYPYKPERVVAIGQVAVDNLLSLGIIPTMIVGMPREKNIPWQTAIMGNNVKFVTDSNFMDPNPEAIAAAKPDLIVGDVWRIIDTSYEKLSKVAPTIGPASYEPEQIGWKEQLRNLGKIFGKEQRAEQVIANDKALFAQARQQMPGLKGKTGIASQYIGKAASFGVIAQPMIPGNAFFIDLGMTIPPAIVNAPNQVVGRATISQENIAWLNADFGLFGPRDATVQDIRNVPGFNELKEVRTGAYYITPKPYLLQAINQPSALSRAYALKTLRPQLEIAARG